MSMTNSAAKDMGIKPACDALQVVSHVPGFTGGRIRMRTRRRNMSVRCRR